MLSKCSNYHTKQQVDLPFVFLRCFSGSKSKLFDHNSPKLSLIRINLMHFSLLDSHFRQFCEIQISTTFVYIFWADRQLTELMSECARRKTQLRCFDVNELRLEDNEHFWRWVQTFDETSSKRRKITMKKKRRKQQIDGKNKLFQILDSIKRDIDAILAVLCFDFFSNGRNFNVIRIDFYFSNVIRNVHFCHFLSLFVRFCLNCTILSKVSNVDWVIQFYPDF